MKRKSKVPSCVLNTIRVVTSSRMKFRFQYRQSGNNKSDVVKHVVHKRAVSTPLHPIHPQRLNRIPPSAMKFPKEGHMHSSWDTDWISSRRSKSIFCVAFNLQMPSRNEIQFFNHPLLLRLLGIIIKGRSRDSESLSLVLVVGEWGTHIHSSHVGNLD